MCKIQDRIRIVKHMLKETKQNSRSIYSYKRSINGLQAAQYIKDMINFFLFCWILGETQIGNRESELRSFPEYFIDIPKKKI